MVLGAAAAFVFSTFRWLGFLLAFFVSVGIWIDWDKLKLRERRRAGERGGGGERAREVSTILILTKY